MKHYECKRCGRKLKTPESQEVGYGKVCHKKYLASKNAYVKLFDVDELPEVVEEKHENN